MNVPKIAVIGCGTVAQRYYAPAIQALPEVRKKVILVDRDRGNAEALQKLLGCGDIYADHRDVIGEADGALILLPHDLHYPVSLDFLTSGVPVLCEKPLASSPQEARELISASETANAALCMNNTRRIFPSFRAVRAMIRAGDLGRIREMTYREGGVFGWPSSTGFYVNPGLSSRGVLLDLGAHVMDTICWWAGGKPVLKEFTDDSRGGPESVARVSAEKDGCEIRVILNRFCELENAFKVTGEKGQVEGKINDWRHILLRDDRGSACVINLPCRVKSYPAFVLPILKNFIGVVQGVEQPLVSGRDVLASIELIHECYENRRQFPCAWERRPDTEQWASRASVTKEHRRILVTGAGGFIGCRVMEMIHESDPGAGTATAGLRQWASAARLGRMPVSIALMDLLDKKQVSRALDNITHVIHCAKGTPEATVEGTRNLLDACLAKGVRHVIHMSTAEVYGDARGLVDETYPLSYTGNPYNRMKIDAEKSCRYYQEKGLLVTIFRPSIVYGPFSTAWSLRFAAMFLAGEWGIFEGYGEGTCNLVYVDDLVQTILAALDHKEAFGKAFNVNGPEVVSWNAYFAALNSEMGLPPLRHVGKSRTGAAMYALGPVRALGSFVKKHFIKPVKKAAEAFDILDAAMRRAERAVKTTPSLDELKLFSRDVVYSDALARGTLPLSPGTTIGQGMKNTVGWLRYMGLLEGSNGRNSDPHR